MEASKFLSAREAAAYIGMSESHLNFLARNGLVPHIQLSKGLRKWTKEMLDEYVASTTFNGKKDA